MAITRWEPFKDLMIMQERMNRLFNEFFSRPAGYDEEGTGQGAWAPLVDICETDDDMILKAELPGMKQEDIQIEIRENVLTLKGERKQENDLKEGQYHRVERSFGAFQRLFTLPNAIQPEKVKARYKDGVLEITMPKAEVVRPRHIDIEG